MVYYIHSLCWRRGRTSALTQLPHARSSTEKVRMLKMRRSNSCPRKSTLQCAGGQGAGRQGGGGQGVSARIKPKAVHWAGRSRTPGSHPPPPLRLRLTV